MNRTLKLLFVCLFLLNLGGATTVEAAAAADENQLKLEHLTALIEKLQQVLVQTQAIETFSNPINPTQPSNSKANAINLKFTDISIDRDRLGGNSMGHSLPDQKITVTVQNNKGVFENDKGQTFISKIVLYEKVPGRDVKTKVASTNKALIPDYGGEVTFDVPLEGGTLYNGKDMERTFYVKVMLDSDHKIKETNERDNSMTSKSWIMEYYKG